MGRKDWRGAGQKVGKKCRAIIPQLLEISVSINPVSPRLRRRRRRWRRFALPGWFSSFRARGTLIRVYMYEICVSFEFWSIDDELIATINKLTDIDTGQPDAVFIAINAVTVSMIGICQLV